MPNRILSLLTYYIRWIPCEKSIIRALDPPSIDIFVYPSPTLYSTDTTSSHSRCPAARPRITHAHVVQGSNVLGLALTFPGGPHISTSAMTRTLVRCCAIVFHGHWHGCVLCYALWSVYWLPFIPRLPRHQRYLPIATSGSTVRFTSSIPSSGAPRRPAM